MIIMTNKNNWLVEFTDKELKNDSKSIIHALEMSIFTRTQERKRINNELKSLRNTIKQLKKSDKNE